MGATRRRNPDAVRPDFVASLAEQMAFLEANLETDIGGNHLVKNIKALLWASVFFDGRDVERWRALGLKLLREELPTRDPAGRRALRALAVLSRASLRRSHGMPPRADDGAGARANSTTPCE